ncbi:DedA family protein [Agromyces laixinhei]|uniref:DedA family protein n=1 Tax=Agromyces laixinhei TaxID=2585717 RepID=UPI001115B9D8|nr:VTT domain-containing protein [Agromyces laixinhei]
MDDAWLVSLAASPWLLPAVFALVVGDAFFVVLPSETVVVALGALSASTGSPQLWQLVPVAAAGAVVGDGLCYLIGRRVGLDRWRWQRTGRTATAIGKIRTAVHRRTALLVFTARYVPFARIAVNLAAGAGRVPLRRYLPLSAAAGMAWALFNVAIGSIVGGLLRDSPLLAAAISVPIAIVLGVVVDRVVVLLDDRRARGEASLAGETADEVPEGTIEGEGIPDVR